MLFSGYGIWISGMIIALCCVFFFLNQKPKFIVPLSLLRYTYWIFYVSLLLSLFVSLVILPLQLSFVDTKYVLAEKNIPVQIIFDVSLSMSANDIEPSRFSAAKNALIWLVHHLDWYYMSLITFSWKPFVFLPFSSDASAIITALNTMNLGDFPPVQDFLWTAIGDAMLLGIHNLQQFSDQKTYAPGIVVLITDGDSNVGFDPLDIISYYKKTDIPLYVFWVGQENYMIGQDSWHDSVVTDINPWLLHSLSDTTWWKFYRILGVSWFTQSFDEISEHIFVHQQKKIHYTYRNLNPYILYFISCNLFVFIILKIYFLWSRQKK